MTETGSDVMVVMVVMLMPLPISGVRSVTSDAGWQPCTTADRDTVCLSNESTSWLCLEGHQQAEAWRVCGVHAWPDCQPSQRLAGGIPSPWA